jgi:cytochrome c oxidase assembly protein subunit 15
MTSHNRSMGLWLAVTTLLLMAMISLGGVTRLTGSGLSIVRWAPVVGVVPPLSRGAWEAEFALYRQSPEFRQVHPDMSLSGFQRIFWLEYLHRLLGRMLGLWVGLPLVFFALKRALPRGLLTRLLLIFCLGGLQGAIGWLMVKSGLESIPHVSVLRLMLHLGMGLFLYASVAWTTLDVWRGTLTANPDVERLQAEWGLAGEQGERPSVGRATRVTLLCLSVTVLLGALVAGLHAGLDYPTFPTMNGQWVPDELFGLSPLWRNFYENAATAQFFHRLLAMVTVGCVALAWGLEHRTGRAGRADVRHALNGLLLAVLLQASLGIATVLLEVPLVLAALHQLGAVVLLTATLVAVHVTRSSRRSRQGTASATRPAAVAPARTGRVPAASPAGTLGS